MDQQQRELEWTMLMRAAVAGDQDAYGRLLEALAVALRSMARRGFARAGLGSADVEDVVQEALLAIHLKRHTWDRSKSVGPWVSAIARYKLVDAIRRRGRARSVQIDDFLEEIADDTATHKEDARDVERVLAPLKDRQRDIVRSVSIDGCSIRETAQRLQMTEVAVRVSLHRSLKQLATRLRDDPE